MNQRTWSPPEPVRLRIVTADRQDDWQDELLAAPDPGVVLCEGELASVDRLFGIGAWRDWSREELYVALVFCYAQDLAFELLARRVPGFLFGDRVGPVLRGLGGGHR